MFSGSSVGGQTGLASIGGACQEKFNINSISYGTIRRAADIFAHELGHNLGIQ